MRLSYAKHLIENPTIRWNIKSKMNDAKGHASNLLILSLATVLVGAGVISWSLNQSNLFKDRPGSASSLAEKNTVSESIMTNQPAQNPVKIRMPEIKAVQTKKPDGKDDGEANAQTAATPTVIQEPQTHPEETLTPEKNTATATQQNEIATSNSATPSSESLESSATDTHASEAPTSEEPAIPASTNATDTHTSEAPIIEETPVTTELAATEVAVPEKSTEIQPDNETRQTPEKTNSTVAENATTDTHTSEAPTSEEPAISASANATDTHTSEAPAIDETPVTTELAATEVATPEKTTEIQPDNETRQAPEKTNSTDAEASDEVTQTADRQKSGWIYAGHYENGKWLKRGLDLPDDKLPEPGNTYKLIWASNVRLAPPGKRKANSKNLAKNIGYLAENQEVKVTSVKNSGKTGHIWLEIEY